MKCSPDTALRDINDLIETLSDVENNKDNYSVATLNQIFRPFRLRLGLVYL